MLLFNSLKRIAICPFPDSSLQRSAICLQLTLIFCCYCCCCCCLFDSIILFKNNCSSGSVQLPEILFFLSCRLSRCHRRKQVEPHSIGWDRFRIWLIQQSWIVEWSPEKSGRHFCRAGNGNFWFDSIKVSKLLSWTPRKSETANDNWNE